MLMPQDQIRSLNGLTEDIYKSLENIGIKYMLQLVTMTRSQVLCIKGICDAELTLILEALTIEGMGLALRPMEFVVEPMGPDRMASGRKEIPGSSFGGPPDESGPGEYDPRRDPRLKNVRMGIHLNEDLGVVEFVFPVPMIKIQFEPHNAIAVANLITQKAQSLLLMVGAASDKIM
jgi:hypothetical protein